MPRLFSIRPTLSLKGRKFKGIRGFAGKPFHPPLTDIPIACFMLAGVFDIVSYVSYSRNELSTVAEDFFISSTHLLVAGAIVTVPTIITGFWDWLKSTPNGSQAWRTANWHMAVMLTVSTIVAFDLYARLALWQSGDLRATTALVIMSGMAMVLVGFGALFGGTMVYDYAFNVEQDFDHAYATSEVDKMPGEETPSEESTAS